MTDLHYTYVTLSQYTLVFPLFTVLLPAILLNGPPMRESLGQKLCEELILAVGAQHD